MRLIQIRHVHGGRRTGVVNDGAIELLRGGESVYAFAQIALGGRASLRAVVEGAGQILAVLPTELSGVTIGKPLELMALQGSITAEIRCEQVRLPRNWLLAGPVERVMQTGKGGTGGLETSCLALGLAGAAIAVMMIGLVRGLPGKLERGAAEGDALPLEQ